MLAGKLEESRREHLILKLSKCKLEKTVSYFVLVIKYFKMIGSTMIK